MAAPSQAAARLAVLERMERRLRRLWWLLIPLVAVAAVDLVAGQPIGDRRVDLAALVGAAMQAWGHVTLRRSLRRRRVGSAQTPPTRSAYVRAFASSALSLAVAGGLGYVLFGWLGAVAVLATTAIVGGLSIAAGSLDPPPSR